MLVGVGVLFSWGVGGTGSFVGLGMERAVDRDWRCSVVVLIDGELICCLSYVLLREMGCLGFAPFEAKPAS